MPNRRLKIKKPPSRVPATIFFKHAKNEKGNRQICVYAQCILSDKVVGPVWGHSAQSIKKAVSMLTRECDRPARFHRPQDFVGKRVLKSARRDR